MKNLISKARGFTLIELLITIAIIALLTSIIMTNFTSARGKARDSERISDLGQIQLALTLFFDRCRDYPNLLTTIAALGCPATTPATNLGTYISQIPADPTGTGAYAYGYSVDTAHSNTNYLLHATLEYPSPALQDSITFATQASSYPFSAAAFSCYDASSHPLDYCIGPK